MKIVSPRRRVRARCRMMGSHGLQTEELERAETSVFVRTAMASLFVLCSTLACASGPSSPSPDNATITIDRSGVSPASVRINAPSRVTFVNNDTRPHTMVSDPVGIHSDCPPINDVGFLAPGARRSTGTLNHKPRVAFTTTATSRKPR